MYMPGLGAPDIHVPLKSSHLHPGVCGSMAGNKAYWGQPQDMNNLYFCLDPETMARNARAEDPFAGKHSMSNSQLCPDVPRSASRPSQLHPPRYPEPSYPSPPEGDQVVPSFQRLSVYEHHPSHSLRKGSKPLPPLPGSADEEAEFFTGDDESCRLVPERCSEALSFCYGSPSRRHQRARGYVNFAYLEGPTLEEAAAPARYVPREQREEGATGGGVREGAWQTERPQRRLRRTKSGPGGFFKAAGLRGSCHYYGNRGQEQDKPEVPPRVPIPPRPAKTAAAHRWSAEIPSAGFSGDDDRPPKVPPREPQCFAPPRPTSPRSLPIYVNGVMPPTQSFAPNPEYVSKGLQRQLGKGVPPPSGSRPPCILPIIEDGEKSSGTHYYLLPRHPAYLDKLERFFRDKDCEGPGSVCS